MFKVGEKVVYPAHGVGVIQSVQTRVISGTEKTFYMLRILDNDMTIMIPTENVASVGLRRIIGKDMVTKVYKILRETRVEIDQQTWNRRYREYTEKIKTGSVLEIATVLRDLFVLKGRQGAVVRRAQDAGYRSQPAGQGAVDRSLASGREDHGRAERHLRSLSAQTHCVETAGHSAGGRCHCAICRNRCGRRTRDPHGRPTAKAFLDLAGTPMVIYSLRTLGAVDGLTSMVLVVAADYYDEATALRARYGPWPVPISVARGGTERQDSVAAGLALLDAGTDLVIVHDAARPFVSPACISSCVRAAHEAGAAIVALPARDTVKVVADDGTIVRTLDRQTIWLAQTPQVFQVAVLQEAYARARRDGYLATDDAALVERLGRTVRVVSGEPANRKITTPDDLRWAESYVRTHLRGGAQ